MKKATSLTFVLLTTFLGVWRDSTVCAQTSDREAQSPVVLAIVPPIFNQALQPWIERRQEQGYDVMLLPLAATSSDGSVDFGVQMKPVATPEEIRAKILKVSQTRPIRAIIIIGDGAPTANARYGWRDVVPAPRVKARVVQIFGSEESLASDAFYADFDGDGRPDAPIGRIPVETVAELTQVVEKIERYETASPAGNWTRRVNLVAGPNGLDLRAIGSEPGGVVEGANPLRGVSALVDSVVTNMAKKLFAEYLPQDYSTTLTQFSLQSVFCPYPPDFGNTFLERANEGCLFLVYMGHGRVLGLDRYYSSQGKDYGIFEIGDCQYLNSPKTSPIACFFACYTGAYDASVRSLAEETAISPNGPVAVIGASRRTAPYGMCVLGSALLESAFDGELTENSADGYATLGDVYYRAQRLSLESFDEPDIESDADEKNFGFDDDSVDNPSRDDSENVKDDWETRRRDFSEPGASLEWLNMRLERGLKDAEKAREKIGTFRQTIDRAAALLDPTASRLDEQVQDHINEFNLFGDPLLKVKFPTRVKIDAPEIAYSTEEFVVSGTLPLFGGAEAIVQGELLLADYRSNVQKPNRAKTFVEGVEAREEYEATYRAANQFVVDAVRTKTKNNGVFSLKIKSPPKFSGECVVRIAAFNGTRYYIGSKRILMRPRSVSTTEQR